MQNKQKHQLKYRNPRRVNTAGILLFALFQFFQMLFQHQIDVLGQGAVICFGNLPKFGQNIAVDRNANVFL